jgi:FMN phosphatase YigB (HAD superfamily)
MTARRPEAVVFDLGGVLVDWDPRRLYRTMLGSDEEIAEFFDEVDFAGWNHRLDAGERTWAEAVADHAARFPHRQHLLAAYPERFPETLGGVIDGTVRVVEELHGAGVRLLALTNWSAELFPHARERFAFLRLLRPSSCRARSAWPSRTRGSTTCCSPGTASTRPAPSSSTTARSTSRRPALPG